MGIGSFLLLLIIAALTGSVGAKLAGRARLGCLTSIVLGFIGAFLGSLLAEKLELPLFFTLRVGRQDFPVIWAVIGSALFIALLNLFNRPPRVH